MPQVFVYVRNSDIEKWRAVEKKSLFIHNALMNTPVGRDLYEEQGVVTYDSTGRARTPEPFVPKAPDPETGYPCCQKAKPCKHWLWNDIDQVWQNELTNKTKDV